MAALRLSRGKENIYILVPAHHNGRSLRQRRLHTGGGKNKIVPAFKPFLPMT